MQVTGFVAMSHAPYWNLSFDHVGPGSHFVEAVARARDRVAALKPDAVVVFGPDHFRNFFFDSMPRFCIGIERVEAIGDYYCPKGELAKVPDWARALADRVGEGDFDPAVSLNMGIDHGISQAYAALTGDSETPIVPIMLNCSGYSSPSLQRCFDFGRAVGDALRALAGDSTVVVMGSGGLSHSPASGSPYDPELAPERRDYLVNGRPRMEEFNKAMNQRLAERSKDQATGRINSQWDAWLLDHMRFGDLAPILIQSSEEILREGGTGGHEVRAWIAALGAWSGDVAWTDYEAVPTWITGMGVACS